MTERQMDRQTDIKRHREPDRLKYNEKERKQAQRDRQINRQTDSWTDKSKEEPVSTKNRKAHQKNI